MRLKVNADKSGVRQPSRKFVLDEPMSRYLLDLSCTLLRGGLRKRINLVENARRLARLPHPLTWIEYDYRAHLCPCP